MARHIIDGYDVSGTTQGPFTFKTFDEYRAIPGRFSDNILYFITDRNEIHYNNSSWGSVDSGYLVPIVELTYEEYQAMTPETRNRDILHFITDRMVIMFHDRAFGDIDITYDDGTSVETFIFYQFNKKYKELLARIEALEA